MIKKIIPLSILDTVSNHNKLKFIFVMFMLICLVACDSTEIKFQNKAKGSNPKELVGEYQLKTIELDSSYFDTISIAHILKSNYIIKYKTDTMYYGEIRKKKNNYYLNVFDSATGYWEINSFSIKKDSVYNFHYALLGYNDNVVDYFNFWEYEKIEKEGLITYIIDNDKKGTYDAFSDLLENSSVNYLKKIIPKEKIFQDLETTEPEDAKVRQSLKIYPNPFTTSISVEQRIIENGFLQIINLSGQVLREITINKKTTTIDLSNLRSGIYIARFMYNESDFTTIKIVKE